MALTGKTKNYNLDVNKRVKEKEKLLDYLTETKEDKDVIQKSMGIFGRWHFWVCFVIFLVRFPVAWHQLNIVLVAPEIDFICIDDVEKCSANCTAHEFNRSIFMTTIISEWDLVCEDAYWVNVAQSVTMIGIMIGSVLFGFWSDRKGRKPPMVVAVIIQLIAGVLLAFVPWFWASLILRLIIATVTGGTMVTSFVLVMELVGTKWRTTVGTLYQIPFNLGYLTLGGFGYFIREWRILQFAISLPSILFISYYWILPESPRWLLTVNETNRAISVLEKAAHYNKLPTQGIKEDVIDYMQNKTEKAQDRGNVIDLIRTKNMRIRTFCCGFNWLVVGLCYFGVTQYIGELGGDLFLNIALSGLVQIAGSILTVFILDKLGRRITLILANLLAGLSMLCVPSIPSASPEWVKPIFAVISMFALAICFATVYIYSGELFPTVVRNVGVGSSSMSCRFGSIVAPFVSTIGRYAPEWISPVIFGIVPIIGAILCLWLPETTNCKLPDTIEEVEAFEEKTGRSNEDEMDW